MSSAFWDGMDDGLGASIETMGEEVLLDGKPVMGVVDPPGIDQGMAPGGRKEMVQSSLLVAIEGLDLRDGMPAQVRGKDGRVDSWEMVSQGFAVLRIGAFNRWSGEIPGV